MEFIDSKEECVTALRTLNTRTDDFTD